MKGIYSEAKQQLSNCMLHSDCEDDGPTGPVVLPRTRNKRRVRSMAVRTTSAYDTLEHPYRCDQQRGRWAKTVDFYFASMTHAFSTMAFSEVPVYALILGGWKYFLLSYLMAICFCTIPIFLIQTFLGQFSSSGTISAFRVSPIFKGIGYSMMLLNLVTLSYYSITAAVPFIYAVNSLHQELPWMSCNNTWNTPSCSDHHYYNDSDEITYSHSTVEYFRSTVSSTLEDSSSSFSISWSMVLGVVSAWLVTLALLLKSVSFIGKVMRCACVIMFGIFLSIFVYLIIYHDVTWDSLGEYLHPMLEDNWSGIMAAIRSAILMASLVLGPGLSNVLTLASYNRFRSDSERLTIWVSISHVVVFLMALICSHVAFDHFEVHVGMLHNHVEANHNMQFLYLCFAYLFGSMSSLPQLWSFLFFAVLFAAELCALVIQMMNVLTALFDEFERLRSKKKLIIIGLVLCLMISSIYFCTQHGFHVLDLLPNMALFSHLSIYIVLLVMTTWIYGRARFQCDLQFMLGKTISNMKIFFIRFISPIFLGACIWQLLFVLMELHELNEITMWLSQGVVYMVTLGYMIYKMCQTSGTWRQRIRQCFMPHDWHPVDADNRRFYEEIMGTSEMLVINSNNSNVA